MQIYLRTLGCRLNEAELQTWAQAFQQAGHKITRNVRDANLIIVNSCAVTQDAVIKSKQLIKRIHRNNPTAKMVLSGCYATLQQQEAEELMGVDLVIGNTHKDGLVETVLKAMDLESMPALSTEPGASALFNRGRQRAFVKVQDGCRYRCTFCIVTVARGTEKSRAIKDIIDEINALQQQGIREIILTGVHLGGYGSDIKSNLGELLNQVIQETDILRIRLGSLEPWDLPDNFFRLFANPRMMPHLHLPLQSGSDSILRRMARRCKTTEFREIVRNARDQVQDINITTDIIVGFPGETEQEWRESYDFIAETGFGHLHIFNYSPRQGTKAALLPSPVRNEIKKQRSRQLHQLAEDMKQDMLHANLGKKVQVLWESPQLTANSDQQTITGYTPNYLRVVTTLPVHVEIENKINTVRLDSVQNQHVLGIIQ